HADLIADGECLVLVMGDQQCADAPGLQDVANFGGQAATQVTIQVGEGLVQQQQGRLGSQCPGQCYPLLLSAGQLMGIALAETVQIDQFQQFADYPAAFGVLADAEGDVLRHSQVGKQGVILKYHADAALLRRNALPRTGHHLALKTDLAGGNRLETGNAAQGGGLAAAGGAQQAADVAGPQVQAQVLDYRMAVIAAAEVVQLQNDLGHGAHSTSRNSTRPFCACRRPSACSQTTLRGSSSRSWDTSSPRWAGRQCMNRTSGSA